MPDSPRWFRLSACASLALLGLGAAVQGCGRPAGPVTLRVLVGSSLTEAFGEIGMAYEQEHRGVKVRSAFGGSQEMTARLAYREPADVLVTSDVPAMDGAEGYLTGPRPIVAHNSLTIAVAPGDPRRIRGLADLVRPGLRVVVGAPTVPVGRYARQIFARAGLTVQWGWRRSARGRSWTGCARARPTRGWSSSPTCGRRAPRPEASRSPRPRTSPRPIPPPR